MGSTWGQCPCPTHPPSNSHNFQSNLKLILPQCAMAELRRIPGVHVYGGTAPLAPGVEKIPKQKNIIFNVDLEDSDLKDCPSFKVPFDPERAQPFSSFDEICSALKPEDDKTQCIFNSKDLHAATTGMVAASIVKSVQSINKMRALVEEGIAEKDWIAAIITNTFETGNPPKEGETDLDRGDFDVVKALIKKYPEMALGKILTDKMVDLAGQTGPHLYKCVTEMQVKMDATSGEEQMVLKKRLLNYLERYFYLVCFGAYCRQEGPELFKKPFVAWLDEKKDIADMVEKGIRVWEEITFFSLNMSTPA